MIDDVGAVRRQLAISCADALELMTDHIEGALSRDGAQRMREHLAGCEPCGVYLDQLRATIRVARSAGSEQQFNVDPARMQSLAELFRDNKGT